MWAQDILLVGLIVLIQPAGPGGPAAQTRATSGDGFQAASIDLRGALYTGLDQLNGESGYAVVDAETTVRLDSAVAALEAEARGRKRTARYRSVRRRGGTPARAGRRAHARPAGGSRHGT